MDGSTPDTVPLPATVPVAAEKSEAVADTLPVDNVEKIESDKKEEEPHGNGSLSPTQAINPSPTKPPAAKDRSISPTQAVGLPPPPQPPKQRSISPTQAVHPPKPGSVSPTQPLQTSEPPASAETEGKKDQEWEVIDEKEVEEAKKLAAEKEENEKNQTEKESQDDKEEEKEDASEEKKDESSAPADRKRKLPSWMVQSADDVDEEKEEEQPEVPEPKAEGGSRRGRPPGKAKGRGRGRGRAAAAAKGAKPTEPPAADDKKEGGEPSSQEGAEGAESAAPAPSPAKRGRKGRKAVVPVDGPARSRERRTGSGQINYSETMKDYIVDDSDFSDDGFDSGRPAKRGWGKPNESDEDYADERGAESGSDWESKKVRRSSSSSARPSKKGRSSKRGRGRPRASSPRASTGASPLKRSRRSGRKSFKDIEGSDESAGDEDADEGDEAGYTPRPSKRRGGPASTEAPQPTTKAALKMIPSTDSGSASPGGKRGRGRPKKADSGEKEAKAPKAAGAKKGRGGGKRGRPPKGGKKASVVEGEEDDDGTANTYDKDDSFIKDPSQSQESQSQESSSSQETQENIDELLAEAREITGNVQESETASDE